MSGSPSRPLAKEDMHALFDALSEKLRRKRARANIYVVGGSAMALAYSRERITRDIEARIEAGHGAPIEAVHEVATEQGLARSWLDDQAVSAIPGTRDTRARTLCATEHLTVPARRPSTSSR